MWQKLKRCEYFTDALYVCACLYVWLCVCMWLYMGGCVSMFVCVYAYLRVSDGQVDFDGVQDSHPVGGDLPLTWLLAVHVEQDRQEVLREAPHLCLLFLCSDDTQLATDTVTHVHLHARTHSSMGCNRSQRTVHSPVT